MLFIVKVEYILILKVIVAAFLGALIGLEREISRKVAGLRTHALVSLASALFTSISVDAFRAYVGTMGYDPSRIISNIIVGIGFIGAGAILKKNDRVEGTTTAAGLWAVAAIGVTVGVGLFWEALIVTGVVYGILQSLWIIEKKLRHKIGLRNGDVDY